MFFTDHFSTKTAPRIAAIFWGERRRPHFQRSPTTPAEKPHSTKTRRHSVRQNSKINKLLIFATRMATSAFSNYWRFSTVDFFVNLIFKVFSISTITSKTFTFGKTIKIFCKTAAAEPHTGASSFHHFPTPLPCEVFFLAIAIFFPSGFRLRLQQFRASTRLCRSRLQQF